MLHFDAGNAAGIIAAVLEQLLEKKRTGIIRMQQGFQEFIPTTCIGWLVASTSTTVYQKYTAETTSETNSRRGSCGNDADLQRQQVSQRDQRATTLPWMQAADSISRQ
jgi:hypothetical protein